MFTDREYYLSQVREVLDLKFNHGMTYKEIAQEMGFTHYKAADIVRRYHNHITKENKILLTPFEERMKPYYLRRGIKVRQDAPSE